MLIVGDAIILHRAVVAVVAVGAVVGLMGGPNMMTKPRPVTGPMVPEVHLMLTPSLGASKFVLPTAEALFVLRPSLFPILISRSAIVIITAGDMQLLQVFIVVPLLFATHPQVVTTVDHLAAGLTFLPVVIAGEAVKVVFCSTSSSTMLAAPHRLGFLNVGRAYQVTTGKGLVMGYPHD